MNSYYKVKSAETAICHQFLDELDCNNTDVQKLECPNTRIVRCHHNSTTEINVMNTEYLFCGHNKIKQIIAPNAVHIQANNNKLETIYCPRAKVVNVNFNNLTELNCPEAISICCTGNLNLKRINAPKLQRLFCDRNYDVEINSNLGNVLMLNKNINYDDWINHLKSKRNI